MQYAVKSCGMVVVEFFWEGCSPCADCAGQENHLELIPTVKMETRHPAEGYFGSEFPELSNYFGVIAAWSRRVGKCPLWKNDPLRRNCQNSVWKGFIGASINVLCSNFADQNSVKSCVAWFLGLEGENLCPKVCFSVLKLYAVLCSIARVFVKMQHCVFASVHSLFYCVV